MMSFYTWGVMKRFCEASDKKAISSRMGNYFA